ncbi:MAG: hypothetical protein ACKO5A_08800 [Actinomycetota bacterium]
MTTETTVLLDADTVAGWRRSTPSLEQLHSAIEDLRRQHPDVEVAVVADPSLKWALPSVEQQRFEDDIVSRTVVCAPAGTRDGHGAWIAAVAAAAGAGGRRVVVVTDRAVPDLPIARLGRNGDRFNFDLAGAAPLSPDAIRGSGSSRHHRGRR